MNPAFSKIRKIFFVMFAAVVFLTGTAAVCRAEGTLLSDPSYELLFSEDRHNPGAVVQSVCVSEYYIYTIENTADDPSRNDIVSAYYRKNVDENGNPVKQYSLAGQRDDTHWEHGNGMTYNPKTNEIYVAPYTNLVPENRGCIFVMDPQTLALVRSIKITDSFNILSIAYDETSDQYYVKTNADAAYSNLILNSDFEIISDLGPEDPTPGYNFQAFCKEGDYLIHSPLTINLTATNYLNAYSVSKQQTVDIIEISFGLEDKAYRGVEPEQIIRLDDESFLMVVNGGYEDGSGAAHFYRMKFPNFVFTKPLFGDLVDAGEPSSSAVRTQNDQTQSDRTQTDNSGAENTDTETVTVGDMQDLILGREPDMVNHKEGGTPAAAIIISIAAAAAFAAYVNRVRLKRARARRDQRIRRMRKKIESERLHEELRMMEELHNLDDLLKDYEETEK